MKETHLSPTPEQIRHTAQHYFDKGRCSGHDQFNGRYCRDAAEPDRWCIHCSGLLLLSLLDQRDAEIQKLANQARDISQYLAEANVGACPIPEGVRLLLNRAEQAEASLLRMTDELDEAWEFIKNGYDIEPREFFEKEAPRNGFGYPLVQAIHHIWKRDPKVARLTEARERLKGLSAKWRERAVSITSDFEVMRDDRVKALSLRESANDLDALLAPPEEKKDDE